MPVMPGQDPRQNMVSKDRLNFGMGSQGNPYKKGGKVAHPDEAADKQLIKKMVKSSAMKREEHCWGGETKPKKRKEGGGLRSESTQLAQAENTQEGANREYRELLQRGTPESDPIYNSALRNAANKGFDRYSTQQQTGDYEPSFSEDRRSLSDMFEKNPNKKGGRVKKRKEGGSVFSGPSYPGKVPGVVPGGRMARKSGGKAMTVNVIVAGKEKQPGMVPPAGMMPPGGPPPGARPPVSVPPPQPLAPAAGAPAPMQPPMPQQPPMGRKHGGRTFHSYKDMTAGSASGEGRLEKSDIAAYKKRK